MNLHIIKTNYLIMFTIELFIPNDGKISLFACGKPAFYIKATVLKTSPSV